MAPQQSPEQRTLGVSYRPGRLARIRLSYPHGWRPSWLTKMYRRNHYPGSKSHETYDADLAMELVMRTGELPTSKHDLVVLLTEYRFALLDLASQALGAGQGS